MRLCERHRGLDVGRRGIGVFVALSVAVGCRYPEVESSARSEYREVEAPRPDEDRSFVGVSVHDGAVLVKVVRGRACATGATETVIIQPGRPASARTTAVAGGFAMGAGVILTIVGARMALNEGICVGDGFGGGGSSSCPPRHDSGGDTIAAVGLITFLTGAVLLTAGAVADPPPPPAEIRETRRPRWSVTKICARDPIANVVVDVTSLPSPLHETTTTASDGTARIPITEDGWATAPLDVVVHVPKEPPVIVRVTKDGALSP